MFASIPHENISLYPDQEFRTCTLMFRTSHITFLVIPQTNGLQDTEGVDATLVSESGIQDVYFHFPYIPYNFLVVPQTDGLQDTE